jgi:hypothetical protein
MHDSSISWFVMETRVMWLCTGKQPEQGAGCTHAVALCY